MNPMQSRIINAHPQLLNQSLPSKPENKSGNQNQGIMVKNILKNISILRSNLI